MVKHGFEVSKKHLEQKCDMGEITRNELNNLVKRLRENYRTGKARKELQNAGVKNFMDY